MSGWLDLFADAVSLASVVIVFFFQRRRRHTRCSRDWSSAVCSSDLVLPSGEPVEVDQAIIYRQTEQSGAFMTAYPFDGARRVEFQGGITRISFDQIVQTQAFSLNTGQLISNDSQESSMAAPLTLGTTSAAFVYDTSNFG